MKTFRNIFSVRIVGEFGRIRAYDKDIGPNAVLTYTLASKDTVYFDMDKDEALNEGVLKVYQVKWSLNIEKMYYKRVVAWYCALFSFHNSVLYIKCSNYHVSP